MVGCAGSTHLLVVVRRLMLSFLHCRCQKLPHQERNCQIGSALLIAFHNFIRYYVDFFQPFLFWGEKEKSTELNLDISVNGPESLSK